MRAVLALALTVSCLAAGCGSATSTPSASSADGATAASTEGPATTASGTTAPAVNPRGQAAVVVSVIDGDTIALAGGRHVRLVQIDAPELQQGECYGAEAARVLGSLLPDGARVRLVADSRLDRVDQYGRLLRYVYRGGRNLNLVLVKRGAATVWFYEGARGAFAGRLLAAEQNARKTGQGLWGACPGTPLDPLHGANTGTPATASATTGPSCAGAIPWNDAAAHAGERATVEGPVAGTHYAADTNGQPTFLNVGVDYPDEHRFQVVIWGDDRARFPTPPERLFAGRTICVAGRITIYRGVPEIEASSPSQIAVVG